MDLREVDNVIRTYERWECGEVQWNQRTSDPTPFSSSLSNSKCIVKENKRAKFIEDDQNTSSKNSEVLSFAVNKRIVGDNI